MGPNARVESSGDVVIEPSSIVPMALRPHWPHVATVSDRDELAWLFGLFLDETHSKGSPILPTPRSIAFLLGLFDSYLEDPERGVTVIAPGAGFYICGLGPSDPPWDTAHGKAALGWGLHVTPPWRAQGLSLAMRELAERELVRRGFTCRLCWTQISNQAAVRSALADGFEPVEIHMVKKIGGDS